MRHKEDTSFIRCPMCEAVNVDKGKNNICRRCGSMIYPYVNSPTEKSWAYLIAAMIFYIPANLYPMMVYKQFGSQGGSTIIEGIFEIWNHGDYPIALIILVASVLIPVLKFLMLIYLMLSTHGVRPNAFKISRHKVYYITELIGPWSMIDLFVVAIIAGLIHFSSVEIIAGTASSAFALSVFFTLMAAQSFNIALIVEQ